jgi:integrase|tara:strand:- start:149 stop:1225 length:1077 start_codon:yes stop_codon:yes gene_type:complete
MDKKFPTGIREKNNGLEIRIFGGGKVIHQETVAANPYKDADVRRVAKYRNELKIKLKLGLAFEDEENPAYLQSFATMAGEYLKTLDCKHSTQLSYLSILNNHWMPLFAKTPCASITTRHIKVALSNMDVEQKTRDNILGPLRGVLYHAEVQNNPAAVIKTKKMQKKPIERYTPIERDRILSCLSGEKYVYFALMVGCGFRPGELMGLLRNDFDGQEWHVHQQIVRGREVDSTKTGHRRKVYVPLWVREAMKEMPVRIDSPYFFVNDDGGFYKDTKKFNRAWKTAQEKKQIRYRIPYCCRHTRAAELLSKGTLPGKCAQQLGHSLAVFYNTYAEMIDEYQADRDLSQFEPLPETAHKRI